MHPLPDETHLLHLAAWASDSVIVSEALRGVERASRRVTSLPARAASSTAAADRDVHVLLSIRAADSTLARGWCHDVEAGDCRPYDEWLAAATAEDGRALDADLLDARMLIQDLVERHGASNVTVAPITRLDDLLAPIEQLAALEPGLLAGAPLTTPRPLTVHEAEMIRSVNASFVAEGWPDDVRERYVTATTAALRRQDAAGDGPPPRLPAWARDRLSQVHEATDALISGAGVGVHGDLAALAPATPGLLPAPGLPPAAAARAVAAVIVTSGVAERPARQVAGLSRLDEASVRQVLEEVARRLRPRRRTG